MSYNSTIRQKTGICYMCGDMKKKPLTKGLCQQHYWQSIRQKSFLKAQEKELEQDEDLQTLVSDLDIIFSRYIRLKDADMFGNVKCISCPASGHYLSMDCGHFISRSHMYTRFLEANCRPQCRHCNRIKNGNLPEFAKALELERPGTIEQLQEQAKIIYKYSREELKGLIADYTKKLKQIQKGVLK